MRFRQKEKKIVLKRLENEKEASNNDYISLRLPSKHIVLKPAPAQIL